MVSGYKDKVQEILNPMWMRGEGRFALVCRCVRTSVSLWESKEKAEEVNERLLNRVGCIDGKCVGNHEIVDIDTLIPSLSRKQREFYGAKPANKVLQTVCSICFETFGGGEKALHMKYDHPNLGLSTHIVNSCTHYVCTLCKPEKHMGGGVEGWTNHIKSDHSDEWVREGVLVANRRNGLFV